MQKINFQNLPNTTTPVNATNLNSMQTNVENAIGVVVSDIETITTYSTTEHQVGVWIDDKPIYSQTIDLGFLNSGDTSIQHNIANIDMIIDTKAWFYNSTIPLHTWFPIPRAYPTNPQQYVVTIDVSTTTITLTCGTNYNGTIFKGYATIYYTKTTD